MMSMRAHDLNHWRLTIRSVRLPNEHVRGEEPQVDRKESKDDEKQ